MQIDKCTTVINHQVDRKAIKSQRSSPTNEKRSSLKVKKDIDTGQKSTSNSLVNNSDRNLTLTSYSTHNLDMPVPGGVQGGQNPTQGLVHWMSAVMAEHMTSNTHHDPAVGMHYMWNGTVEVGISEKMLFISGF